VDASAKLRQIARVWLETKLATSFAELLRQVTEKEPSFSPQKVDISVFAVAGPVEGGVYCRPPNIPWEVDLRRAEADYGAKHFRLINDFVAQAWACRSPVGDAAQEILPNQLAEDQLVAVLGAGTGLGKAFLVPFATSSGRRQYLALPSEGGHETFPVQSAAEFRFFEFLQQSRGLLYPTYDDVVSGRGIAAVHEFLTGEKLAPAEVMKSCLPDSPTISWAARFYGRVCRNFALESLCFGGLFIAGGVAVKNPQLVTSAAFRDEFLAARTPQHQQLLSRIGIRLMSEEESGLWGAAFCGLISLEADHVQ